jgi:hypothetical protein
MALREIAEDGSGTTYPVWVNNVTSTGSGFP